MASFSRDESSVQEDESRFQDQLNGHGRAVRGRRIKLRAVEQSRTEIKAKRAVLPCDVCQLVFRDGSHDA